MPLTQPFWQTSRFQIDLSHPKIMGIVNITPDSFSDGGHFDQTRTALNHCEQLLKDGADILDLGAESTRPGAAPVPLDEELRRLLPVLREAVKFNIPISIDTYKSAVMAAALDAGADIINDVWALRQAGAEQIAATHPSCGICLMHMHGEPATMQIQPMQTANIVADVAFFLRERAIKMQQMGINPARITIDPGIGFGKTVSQNFALLARQKDLIKDWPLLAGWSRKSSLAAVATRAAQAMLPASERVGASVAAALIAVQNGASIVRVHDVKETAQALAVWAAVENAEKHV